MHIEQRIWTTERTWETLRSDHANGSSYRIVLVFGNSRLVSAPGVYEEIRVMYPRADIIISSASGEILNSKITENTLALTAIEFENAEIGIFNPSEHSTDLSNDLKNVIHHRGTKKEIAGLLIFNAGHPMQLKSLIEELGKNPSANIPYVVINASAHNNQPGGILGINEQPRPDRIAIIALYGEGITMTNRQESQNAIINNTYEITNAEGQSIIELNGQPALDIFRKHIPHNVNREFGNALLPSLIIKQEGRLISKAQLCSLNENERTLTLMQEVEKGMTLSIFQTDIQSMLHRQNFSENLKGTRGECPELAFFHSSLQRRLILGPYAQKELDLISEQLGPTAAVTGLFSKYEDPESEIHNDENDLNCSITTISEKK